MSERPRSLQKTEFEDVMVEQFNYLMEHHETGCGATGCRDCERFAKVRDVLLDLFKFRQYRMRSAKSLALIAAFLAVAGVAGCQDLTQEERWASELAVYHSQDWLGWWQKMPVEAILDGARHEIANSAPIDVDHHSTLRQTARPRVVDSDGRVLASDSPLPVRLVSWQAPTPVPGSCSGVCVSFSGQGAAALRALTGKRVKGFQLVEATTCADHDARFGAGRIIQQANALGLQTLSSKAGAAVVQQTVDTGWRKWIMAGAQVAVGVGMALTVPGTVAASKAWQTGLVYGHIALDQLPRLLSPGAPNPDPFLNSVLDENSQVTIPAGACVSAMFAGTWDRNAVKVTGKVQLLP